MLQALSLYPEISPTQEHRADQPRERTGYDPLDTLSHLRGIPFDRDGETYADDPSMHSGSIGQRDDGRPTTSARWITRTELCPPHTNGDGLADFWEGMAVFTIEQGGLMYEDSVGGQNHSFRRIE